MDVDPAQAPKYIVNPLSGRKVQFANLFPTHPPTEDRIARLRGGEWRAVTSARRPDPPDAGRRSRRRGGEANDDRDGTVSLIVSWSSG